MNRIVQPDALRLPMPLVKRISETLRLVGLPLAAETGDAGVRLDRGGIPEGHPIDHVAVCWQASAALFKASDGETEPAEHLITTANRALDQVIADILTAAGLAVSLDPATEGWTVWEGVAPEARPALTRIAPLPRK
ncbi:hypothetical protein [Streptomyces sp. NPDC055140]